MTGTAKLCLLSALFLSTAANAEDTWLVAAWKPADGVIKKDYTAEFVTKSACQNGLQATKKVI